MNIQKPKPLTKKEFDELLYQTKIKVSSLLAYSEESKQKAIEALCLPDEIARRGVRDGSYIDYCHKLMTYNGN